MSGTWVRIRYRADGENAVAERIELGDRPEGAQVRGPDQPQGR